MQPSMQSAWPRLLTWCWLNAACMMASWPVITQLHASILHQSIPNAPCCRSVAGLHHVQLLYHLDIYVHKCLVQDREHALASLLDENLEVDIHWWRRGGPYRTQQIMDAAKASGACQVKHVWLVQSVWAHTVGLEHQRPSSRSWLHAHKGRTGI